jgi:restriction system protein
MAIPKHAELTRPMLEIHGDGSPHRGPELEEALASRLGVTDSERQQKNRGGARTFANRIAWAQVDLFQAGLLSRPEPGATEITDRGREVLTSPPEVIDRRYLQRFPEFKDFIDRSRDTNDTEPFEGEGVTREAVISALEEASRLGPGPGGGGAAVGGRRPRRVHGAL